MWFFKRLTCTSPITGFMTTTHRQLAEKRAERYREPPEPSSTSRPWFSTRDADVTAHTMTAYRIPVFPPETSSAFEPSEGDVINAVCFPLRSDRLRLFGLINEETSRARR